MTVVYRCCYLPHDGQYHKKETVKSVLKTDSPDFRRYLKDEYGQYVIIEIVHTVNRKEVVTNVVFHRSSHMLSDDICYMNGEILRRAARIKKYGYKVKAVRVYEHAEYGKFW